MSRKRSFSLSVFVLLLLVGSFGATARTGSQKPSRTWPTHLENTTLFELPIDILVRQHQQIDDYFLKLIQASPAVRDKVWKPDFSSVANYSASLRGHRKR